MEVFCLSWAYAESDQWTLAIAMTGKKYRFWCLMFRTVGTVRHTFNQDLIRKQESQLKISRRKRKKKEGRKKEKKMKRTLTRTWLGLELDSCYEQTPIPGVLCAKTTINIFSLVSIGERKVNVSLGFRFGGRLCVVQTEQTWHAT